MLTAIEVTGTMNGNHQIVLDEDLPGNAPKRVRIIVLFDEESDLNEKDWLRASSNNDAFDFLKDEAEDIYTETDGKPLAA